MQNPKNAPGSIEVLSLNIESNGRKSVNHNESSLVQTSGVSYLATRISL